MALLQLMERGIQPEPDIFIHIYINNNNEYSDIYKLITCEECNKKNMIPSEYIYYHNICNINIYKYNVEEIKKFRLINMKCNYNHAFACSKEIYNKIYEIYKK